MSAVATWPGVLGGVPSLTRTNGLWTPAKSMRLVTGYPSNGTRLTTRTVGNVDRDGNKGGDKGGDKSVTRRENTAARAAAGVP
ncbi:MAG: hypothetical protein WCB58_05205, partial [Acidobacteriaceae bacterium]